MLSGMVLWLEADTGYIDDPQAPGTLLKWQDQSGHKNTAVATLSQNKPAPTFDYDPAALNGHTAIKCAHGGYLQVADDASLQWGTGDFGVAMVISDAMDGFANYPDVLWEKNQGSQQGLWVTLTWMGLLTDAINANQTYSAYGAFPTDHKFHIVVARGPNLSLRIDDASSQGLSASGDISNVGNPAWICDEIDDMEIAEAIAVKGTMSDADVAQLVSYWQTKFGL